MSSGQELRTPTGRGKFRIVEIGPKGFVLLLGRNETRTNFDWADVEGVVPFLKGRGLVEIAGQYDVSAKAGALDWYFKQFVNRATAGWMAVVLEKAGVVEIDRGRSLGVRLKEGF